MQFLNFLFWWRICHHRPQSYLEERPWSRSLNGVAIYAIVRKPLNSKNLFFIKYSHNVRTVWHFRRSFIRATAYISSASEYKQISNVYSHQVTEFFCTDSKEFIYHVTAFRNSHPFLLLLFYILFSIRIPSRQQNVAGSKVVISPWQAKIWNK